MTGTENAALSNEQRWLKQEHKMFSRIENDLRYCNGEIKLCRLAQTNLSIAVMIFGVLTPVVIAEAGKTDSFFGSSALLTTVATGMAALAAILEGIRRIGRFDRRWIANYSAATKNQAITRPIQIETDRKACRFRRLEGKYRSLSTVDQRRSRQGDGNIFQRPGQT